MSKKAILLFSRNLLSELEISRTLKECVAVEYLNEYANECLPKCIHLSAFVTADNRLIDIDELFLTGVFQTYDECECLFWEILEAYSILASKNNFYCVLVTLTL